MAHSVWKLLWRTAIMTNRPALIGLPASIRCAFAIFAIVTLNLTAASGRDRTATNTTYRCTTKDAVDIRQDGSLSHLTAEQAVKYFDKIAINVADGHITYPSTGVHEDWTVEKANDANADYVLFPPSSRKTRANAVTHFIRLRTSDAQPRFIVIALSFLVSGPCALAPD